MADTKFPRAYQNSVQQDDGTMKYLNEGDFSKTGIGARPSGKPGDVKSQGMNLEHVGDNAARK